MDAYEVGAALQKHMVLRITFRSGGVVEERGDQDDVDALFEQDVNRLIDHVYGIDLFTDEVLLVHHEEDRRWDDFTPDIAF